MRERRWFTFGGSIVCFALAMMPVIPAAAARDDAALARADARRFLHEYVQPDGRVVRTDQGGDTVGEGQSYALALALVADDEQTFDRVWKWTDHHLRRPDGLLAHHAGPDGAVDDPNSATDADVVTAWALLRADHNDAQRSAGKKLAEAIVEDETLDAGGARLLAAGQWATGSPGSLNASYWALPFLDDLADLTGDDRWSALHDDSLATIDHLTDSGRLLPPDWARVDRDRVTATPAPSGDAPEVRYSLDAQRVVVWCATAGGDGKTLAASWWEVLERRGLAGAVAAEPNGKVIEGSHHPLGYVAAAAAAFAAGDTDAGHRLLKKAAALDRQDPTYYGSAWVALGRALLTTDLLGGERP